jgi:preprotein translocase subunit SecF
VKPAASFAYTPCSRSADPCTFVKTSDAWSTAVMVILVISVIVGLVVGGFHGIEFHEDIDLELRKAEVAKRAPVLQVLPGQVLAVEAGRAARE